jgi:putative hydrolase of the HAD superfamily
MPIHAVLFDLDDTLCDDTGQMFESIRDVASLVPGGDPEVIAEGYWRISHRFWTYEIHQRPPEPLESIREMLWRQTLSEAGIAHSPAELKLLAARYGEAREKTPPPFPDAQPTLAQLKALGLRLGLVTNGVSESHTGKLARLELGHYFDTVLMPDQTGFAKPDPRQFHLACQRLGVLPAHTLHVGDSLVSDVGGARGAGLRAVWYNPTSKPLPESAAEPHHTIGSLAALLLVLAEYPIPR